uniref:Uncharacterized protein n=1 Tax=Meloidogyne enterolobii TaxID=390850 RepID=A0A6V7Y599_MELEN|nr:unnamed protein product [Meloidogyne enterolobii]
MTETTFVVLTHFSNSPVSLQHHFFHLYGLISSTVLPIPGDFKRRLEAKVSHLKSKRRRKKAKHQGRRKFTERWRHNPYPRKGTPLYIPRQFYLKILPT